MNRSVPTQERTAEDCSVEIPNLVLDESFDNDEPNTTDDIPFGAGHSQKGSEFSLEYLPNPMEVIEELNNIQVGFVFEDETAEQVRKRRATISKSQDSFSSDVGFLDTHLSYNNRAPLPTIPNERQTIQNELLRRLEALNDMDPTYVHSVGDDGVPRLGVYTQEERIDRINKYREKRKRRVFGKVRYVLRQRASEGRARVKGRFAREETGTASDNSPASHVRDREIDEMTAVNLHESTSWLEKMSLGVRRLSGSFSSIARKRSSLPSQPASSMQFTEEDDAKTGSGSSSSSWLLKNRRKSSQSAASGRFSDHGNIPAFNATPANADDLNDIFFMEQNVEPDRKRLTSGSSVVLHEIVPDPRNLDGNHQ